jgi:nicotinamidase-related amidase
MTTALVLVDIQNDYFPGGAMALVGMSEAARCAAAALAHARERGWPVIHIQHLSIRPGATFFIPGTGGAEHHACVKPAVGEAVVVKHYPNAFRESDLAMELKKVSATKLVVVGAMSHMCIDATTRAAFDLGYECTVLSDACATRDLGFEGTTVPAAQVHASFMAALSAPYAQVVPTAIALAE